MSNTKTIIIDIDGVICSEEKTHERMFAKPNKQAISHIKELYLEGHTIILHTARSWAEFKMTNEWLVENEVLFDSLVCGKPCGDYVVDDRSFKSVEELIEQTKILSV